MNYKNLDTFDNIMNYVFAAMAMLIGGLLIFLVGIFALAIWDAGFSVVVGVAVGTFLFGLATREMKRFLEKRNWLP